MKTQASNTALITGITKQEALRVKILKHFKGLKKRGVSTILELAAKFNEPNSTITARVSKLQEMGIVYVNKSRQGRKYTSYSYERRDSTFRAIRANRYNEHLKSSWAERGLKKYRKTMSPELIKELENIIK